MNADLDEPLPELDNLTRREFAVKFGVDPRYVARPETPELDERKRVADALGVAEKYLPADVLVESGVDNA